jgi:SRSO17 transposase
MRRDEEHRPVSVKELALGLPESDWQTITWREGSCEPLSSRFARVRVRPGHRDYNLTAPRPEEWLVIEWPEEEEAELAKYWLSTLPQDISFALLVDTAKLRWRIERGKANVYRERQALTYSISNRKSVLGITTIRDRVVSPSEAINASAFCFSPSS